MITVATLLWDKNAHTHPLSGTYDESWVEKLYRSFARNLTRPFRFVLFTERLRTFAEPIEQMLLSTKWPTFSNCIEPYKLNEPMILVGLDTCVVGNIDHFADYCLTGDKIAMMRDRKSYRLKAEGYPDQSINGVALVPAGWRRVYDEWAPGENDMKHMRKYPWLPIDDKWGMQQIVSYKVDVRSSADQLPTDARMVYWHGQPKQTDLMHLPWMQKHWR